MKKKFMPLICSLLLLALAASGCLKAGPITEYQKASEKTENAGSARVMVEFSHRMDFDGAKFADGTRKSLEMFKEVKGVFTSSYRREKDISYLDGHVDMMGMGFDVKVYQDGDKTILMLPMFTKYLVLDNNSLISGDSVSNSEKQAAVSDIEAGKKLRKLWNGLVNEKNITRLEDKLISTPEGDIKTEGFRIALDKGDVRNLFLRTVDIILTDREIRSRVVSGMMEYPGEKGISVEDAEKTFDQLAGTIKNNIANINVEDFEHVVYIDKDSYLVEESTACKTTYSHRNTPVEVNFNLSIKRWAFGKEVKIDFPGLNDSNSFTMKDINRNTPKMFERLLNPKWGVK